MKLPKLFTNITQQITSQFSNPKPNSILYNRFILYFVFIIALFQLYTFSVAGKMAHIAIFLLVTFLTSFFSKNMIVILVIALAFTGLIQIGLKGSLEGMVDGNGKEESPPTAEGETPASETKNDKTPDEKKDEAKPSEKKETTDKNADTPATPEDLRKTQEELKQNQDKIIQGFQEIEPYMNQAESLVAKINDAYAKK